jgi:hypothetical protein
MLTVSEDGVLTEERERLRAPSVVAVVSLTVLRRVPALVAVRLSLMMVVSVLARRKAESNLVREASVTVATSAAGVLVRVLILMGTPASATVVLSELGILKADNILTRFSMTATVSLGLLDRESRRVNVESAIVIESVDGIRP